MAQGTSTLIAGLRGSVGNISFTRTKTGVAVRQRTRPRDPNTAAQQGTRTRMARVAQAWKSMTLAQSEAWRAYADSLAAPDPVTGMMSAPRPQLLFNKLGIKVLQINEYGPVPLTPPDGSYLGDSIQVSAVGEAGQIRFWASGSNHPGTKTELLIQRLDSIHCRAFPAKYRSRGFVAFTPGLEIIQLERPGVYAVAFRFVEAATGRETGMSGLGKVVVG